MIVAKYEVGKKYNTSHGMPVEYCGEFRGTHDSEGKMRLLSLVTGNMVFAPLGYELKPYDQKNPPEFWKKAMDSVAEKRGIKSQEDTQMVAKAVATKKVTPAAVKKVSAPAKKVAAPVKKAAVAKPAPVKGTPVKSNKITCMCFGCGKEVIIGSPVKVKTASGQNAIRGVCLLCGKKLFKFLGNKTA